MRLQQTKQNKTETRRLTAKSSATRDPSEVCSRSEWNRCTEFCNKVFSRFREITVFVVDCITTLGNTALDHKLFYYTSTADTDTTRQWQKITSSASSSSCSSGSTSFNKSAIRRLSKTYIVENLSCFLCTLSLQMNVCPLCLSSLSNATQTINPTTSKRKYIKIYCIFAHITRGLYHFLRENGHPAGHIRVEGVQIFFTQNMNLCLSVCLSELIHFLSHSTCWA